MNRDTQKLAEIVKDIQSKSEQNANSDMNIDSDNKSQNQINGSDASESEHRNGDEFL